MTDALPRPHPEMSPGEKRALLLRYVRAMKDDASVSVSGLDFSDAALAGIEFFNVDFSGIKLAGADLTRVNLTGADLSHARLNDCRLTRSIVCGATLRGTNLSGAHLVDAQCGGARFVGADLRYALIHRMDLTEGYLWKTNLRGVEGVPADRRAVHIDAATYRLSGWSPAHLTEWLRAGAVVERFAEFPPDAQVAVYREFEGLHLFIGSRLLPWDQTVLHAFVCSVLGVDTDVRIAEYVETPSGTACRVRLVGSNLDDLMRVAEKIAEASWRTAPAHALRLPGLWDLDESNASMDYIRGHLDSMSVWRKVPDETPLTDGERLVLARSWEADALRGVWEQILTTTRLKPLVDTTVELMRRSVAKVRDARDVRDLRRWETSIAQAELNEPDDIG